MSWRIVGRIVFSAGEALAKAFTRAVREELRTSQQAGQRHAEQTGQSKTQAKVTSNADLRLGISLKESIEILNVKDPVDVNEVEKNYKHLFSVTDKSKSGSLYLQSKAVGIRPYTNLKRSDDVSWVTGVRSYAKEFVEIGNAMQQRIAGGRRKLWMKLSSNEVYRAKERIDEELRNRMKNEAKFDSKSESERM